MRRLHTCHAWAALALLAALSPAAGRAASPGPYEVKSGVLELKGDALGGETREIVWFDDYGRREARRTTVTVAVLGRKIEKVSVTIRTPERTVQYDEKEKKGRVSRGSAAAAMDPGAMTDATLRKQYNVEELPDRVILGRTCKGASMEPVKGWPVRGWSWKGLPMLTQTRVAGGMSTVEAVRLDLDAPVPDGVFDVPGDVKLSK